jgi:hypothetical protein
MYCKLDIVGRRCSEVTLLFSSLLKQSIDSIEAWARLLDMIRIWDCNERIHIAESTRTAMKKAQEPTLAKYKILIDPDLRPSTNNAT